MVVVVVVGGGVVVLGGGRGLMGVVYSKGRDPYFKYSYRLPIHDDEHGHGQKKTKPSTYVEGKRQLST